MNHSLIQDLYMAGVRWEITDMPTATAIALDAARKNTATPQKQTPVDDIEIPTGMRTPVYSSGPVVVPSITPLGVDTAISAAARPADTESLNRMIAEFNHPLRVTARNTVLPRAATTGQGALMVITDIPSSDDDAAGNILTGAAGELFDKMIGAIGLTRDSISITPLVFWRTPGGRAPARGDIDLARPFVDKFIELTQPRVILTLGTLPATEIAGVNLADAHGKIVTVADRPVMPIFHPNYLMLKPAAKRDAWGALQIVQNLLKND